MPWWVVLYLVVLALLSLAGLVDDARDRRPAWWLGLALSSAVASVALVLAYWEVLPTSPPALLFALLVVAVGFDAWSAVRDLRADAAAPDPELNPAASVGTRLLGVGLGLLLLLPAWGWGLLAALR